MTNTTGTPDHKADTIPGLTTERIKSIVLLAVQLYSLIQTGLSLAGIAILPFTSYQVSTAITGVIALITGVYAWWRNNSITEAGYAGSQLTASIKNGSIAAVQGDSPAPDVTPVNDDASLYATDADGRIVTDTVTGTPVINVE
ncbi:phage holin [Bifidobacterium callitrichos]|uniref:Phage lysis protein n=1 Tax=Bifidobacterium callitrichos DSM 23973 TaxID=1437609 RepID=A0A087ACU9_9BIFI|nr:phage holin [Bifidobacterium callitrichos]KFI56599.1 phage lysis protein [Bifidobacterium callitrichos DSM 23973]